MTKMYLPGRPANHGAHLLAWVIALEGETLIPFEVAHRGMIERILTGTLVPATILGEELSKLTRGRIPLRAWSQPARGKWGEYPEPWCGAWVERELQLRELERKLRGSAATVRRKAA